MAVATNASCKALHLVQTENVWALRWLTGKRLNYILLCVFSSQCANGTVWCKQQWLFVWLECLLYFTTHTHSTVWMSEAIIRTLKICNRQLFYIVTDTAKKKKKMEMQTQVFKWQRCARGSVPNAANQVVRECFLCNKRQVMFHAIAARGQCPAPKLNICCVTCDSPISHRKKTRHRGSAFTAD